MKIEAHDNFTGENVILTAKLTTDHPASSYGQPVMMIEEWNNDLMSAENWVHSGCRVVDFTADEFVVFERWCELIPSSIEW